MATKKQVIKFLEDNFSAEDSGNGKLIVYWAYDDGYPQLLEIQVWDSLARISGLLPVEQTAPEILAAAEQITPAGIAQTNSTFFVRELCLLEHLTNWDALVSVMSVVATAAYDITYKLQGLDSE